MTSCEDAEKYDDEKDISTSVVNYLSSLVLDIEHQDEAEVPETLEEKVNTIYRVLEAGNRFTGNRNLYSNDGWYVELSRVTRHDLVERKKPLWCNKVPYIVIVKRFHSRLIATNIQERLEAIRPQQRSVVPRSEGRDKGYHVWYFDWRALREVLLIIGALDAE